MRELLLMQQKFQESIELAKQRDEKNRQDRLEKFREKGLPAEMKNKDNLYQKKTYKRNKKI